MTELGCGDHYRQLLYQERIDKQLARKKKAEAKPKKVSEKRKRTMAMNQRLSRKKREMWDAKAIAINDDVVLRELPHCGLCGEIIRRFEDCEICHESSRGLGGGKRDDSKVFLGHRAGNRAQGSQSLEAYKSGKTEQELRKLCLGE